MATGARGEVLRAFPLGSGRGVSDAACGQAAVSGSSVALWALGHVPGPCAHIHHVCGRASVYVYVHVCVPVHRCTRVYLKAGLHVGGYLGVGALVCVQTCVWVRAREFVCASAGMSSCVCAQAPGSPSAPAVASAEGLGCRCACADTGLPRASVSTARTPGRPAEEEQTGPEHKP